jgi:hypothetical protein
VFSHIHIPMNSAHLKQDCSNRSTGFTKQWLPW